MIKILSVLNLGLSIVSNLITVFLILLILVVLFNPDLIIAIPKSVLWTIFDALKH
jgi:hypothetical protein